MPSMVEIGRLVLEKKIFFYFVNVFLLLHNYFPLEKGGALHLNKLETPSPKDALCQVWLKLTQWFWRKDENVTSLRQQQRRWTTMDNGQIVIRKAHLSRSSGELKT